MADSLVSVLLGQLASIAYQQIETEVRLVLDVKKEVTKVTSNLKAIRAVLNDAEKKQVTEDTVRDWLEKLKDVFYDMDDVLDEWNTEIMLQVDKQENDGENVIVTKKKDYLTSEGNQENETMGENHFNDLVRRSFFQDLKRDDDGDGTVTVKMHDIVHDFVQFLTKKECFLMEFRDAFKRIELPDYKVRYLTLVLDDDDEDYQVSPLVSSENYKNMRSLTNFCSRYYTLDLDFILQLKSLRTLDLNSNLTKEVPKGIGELLHLRYVDLSWNRELKELPDTICNLYKLETLRLDWCDKLERLPKGIGKLTNLKHLHVKSCYELKLPKEIGRLTSMRVLNVESVCGVEKNDALTLGDLRSLDRLRSKLCIEHLNWNVSEAEKAHLQNKRDLLRLELRFDEETGEDVEGGNVENHVGVLNALQPPPNLEYLEIIRYYGIIPPSWLSLHSLRSLWICECYCQVLPPLGQLRSLETLKIKDMEGLRKIGVEFLGIEEKTQTLSKSPSLTTTTSFPKLKHLSFDRLRDWEEWEGVGGSTVENSEITIMPCLSSLEISWSSRLRSLPDFMEKTPQLHDFKLDRSEFLEEGCKKGGKERARVSHILNITINGTPVRNEGVWVPEYDETDKSDASASKEGDDDDEIIQE